MSAIHSASEHVAVWPVGEPLPSFAGVQQMGVRNLKETLVKMQVDFRGCLTRGDYEKRVLSHLDVLYRAIGEDSQIPALHSDIEARVANAQLADQKIVVHKSSEETTQDLVPSLDDIQAMALPELRDTLRKLGVSSKGCHTKADYRTRLREHVEEHCAGFHDSGDEVESNSIAGSKAQAVADGIDGTKMESMQPSTPATHSGWTSPDSGWASEQETWHPIAKSENEELLEDPSEARYREALLPWLIELSADIWPSMARKNPAIARAVIAVLARADATKGLEAQAVDVGWYLHAGMQDPEFLQQTACTLARLGSAEPHMDKLAQLLRHSDSRVREQAATALGSCAEAAAPYVSDLFARLSDPSPGPRQAARVALQQLSTALSS